MSPATWPRKNSLQERLLWIDPTQKTFGDSQVKDLSTFLRPKDLLVLNDAATLPASLQGKGPSGEALEIRLLQARPNGSFWAVLFGKGDWQTRTEDRDSPMPLWPGDQIQFSEKLQATVEEVPTLSTRLLEIRFSQKNESLWQAIYQIGRPVQYSYVKKELSLWHVQTCYSARPWSVELPSAGRPLTWGLLSALEQKGVRLETLTHAAGLSSTGEPILDAMLPLPERFEIPQKTIEAIEKTKEEKGRVIAVGTTVVRALEGAAILGNGTLFPGEGETDLILSKNTPLQIVDGLFTGMHEPSESHFRLMQAFAPIDILEKAYEFAETLGYIGHEFGDSSLILSS